MPVEELVSLGENSTEIAGVILLDISSHKDSYKISKEYAIKHEGLRETIAELWSNSIESLILSEDAISNIKEYAKELAKKYPEFENISDAERIKSSEAVDKSKKRETDPLLLISLGLTTITFVAPPILPLTACSWCLWLLSSTPDNKKADERQKNTEDNQNEQKNKCKA